MTLQEKLQTVLQKKVVIYTTNPNVYAIGILIEIGEDYVEVDTNKRKEYIRISKIIKVEIKS